MTSEESSKESSEEFSWTNEAVVKQIKGLSCDSRKVESGWLFAALDGEKLDGADYVEQALERGARAVLVQTDVVKRHERLSDKVLWLECAEPRKRYAELAAAWWHKVPETLVGVTGTNGKTSSVFFLQQLWHAAGAESASIGTLGVGRNNNLFDKKQDDKKQDAKQDISLTTAEPMVLHALLAGLTEEGVSHCALEASSHGLAQHRLDGLRFQACILTSFSRDHLDYHKSWEAYRAAKARLFLELLEEGGWMIVPHNDPFAEQLIQDMRDKAGDKAKVIRTQVTGEGETGDTLSDSLPDTLQDTLQDSLQAFGVVREGGRTKFSLRLRCENFCGDREIVLEDIEASFEESFQLHNLLCALAAFFVTDKGGAWNVAWLRETVRGLRCARGRMERFLHPCLSARVYVDYAHTPQALEEVLREGRRIAQKHGGKQSGKQSGKLICVFGCGGERDREKRPEMGRIAGKLADRIVVADDNPRGEDAAKIRAAILQPLRDQGHNKGHDKEIVFEEIGDRKIAIEHAIASMGEGDVVIVAGKGHEQGQLRGNTLIPFDDAAVVRETLQRIQDSVISSKEG